LEILLVVGIIAILAGIVIVAINPSKQLATVRNAERKSDIKQIESAITQYYIDNYEYPDSITGTLTGICNTGSASSSVGITCTNLIDLTVLVPDYITAIPTDPQSTTTNTGYYVKEDATTHKIGVQANLAELDQDIVIGMAASSTPSEEEEEGLGISGLIAHWKMNDNLGTTNVLDNKGSYPGTAQQNTSAMHASSGNPPSINGALSFDGSGDYISTNFTGFSSAKTYTMWINMDSDISSGNKIFLASGDYDSGIYWAYNPGDTYNNLYVPSFWGDGFSFPHELSLNTWHHLAVVFENNNNISYYIDGSLLYTGSYTLLPSAGTLNIGIEPSSMGNLFKGKMDDIRIYSEPLNIDQINQIFAGGAGTEAE